MTLRSPQLVPTPRARSARGFSLIEVMVAVLILALGMLGMASLQATALRNSQSSYENTQAVMLSYAMIDSMRANRNAAIIGLYDLAFPTCTELDGGTLAQNDLQQWIDSLKSNLGDSACGGIACDDAECVVEVRWNDERATNGADERDIRTVTRL